VDVNGELINQNRPSRVMCTVKWLIASTNRFPSFGWHSR
jgi:hypothetical protein